MNKTSGILLLLAVLAAAAGCASWRMEAVAVKTEVQSLPGIEVVAPKVYRDTSGCFAIGHLRARGIGAHDTLAHMHYQVTDGQGKITWERMEPAPSIRHNRFAAQETAHYSFRLEKAPEAGVLLKVVLHRGTAKKCSAQPGN